MHYRIAVQGNIGDRIQSVFPDLETTRQDDLSIVTGPVKDQSQLHGILALIRDLNTPLIALNRLAGDESGHPASTIAAPPSWRSDGWACGR